MVGAPVPYETVWLGATPPDGPVSVGEFTGGFWFEVDTPGIFCGFRYFFTAGEHGPIYGQLWNDAANTLLVNTMMNAQTSALADGTDRWLSFWCHPRYLLAPATRYLAEIVLDGPGIYRHNGALNTSPVVSGHITVPAYVGDGVSGGVYDLAMRLTAPANLTTNNLYGLDILVDFGV